MEQQEQQARSLDTLEILQNVAYVTTNVFAEMKRICESEELDNILHKGQNAISIVTDAGQAAADEVQDMILLALQIYEKSLLRGRSLDSPAYRNLDEIDSRDQLIEQALIRVESYADEMSAV